MTDGGTVIAPRDSLFSDARQRAAQVTVATADEGTSHFAIVLDGNYVRPATDLEVALAKDVRNLLDHIDLVSD